MREWFRLPQNLRIYNKIWMAEIFKNKVAIIYYRYLVYLFIYLLFFFA